MINFQEIEISPIISHDSMGMVFMQPFTNLSGKIPRWAGAQKERQLRHLTRCLEIATRCDHGCNLTQFTVLPEYSLPGLDGVSEVEKAISKDSWKCGVVIIGGIDGLSKNDYAKLCLNGANVHPSNSPEVVRDDQWVNCFVTWVKSESPGGVPKIEKWVQPKLCPSWPEQQINVADMFEGKCINIFSTKLSNGQAFRFFSLVCFDWVKAIDKGISSILEGINRIPHFAPDGKSIDLVFILQCNPKPNHQQFMTGAFDFFHGDYPFVRRDKSIIAFVNNAGSLHPGRCNEYGYSSLVFSSDSAFSDDWPSPASYAMKSRNLRGNDGLQTCKDALFRERGECLHSFRLFLPSSVQRIPNSRRRPLDPVLVHTLDEEVKDPRARGQQVPAVVKWANDNIDCIGKYEVDCAEVEISLNDNKQTVATELKWCEWERMSNIISTTTTTMAEEETDRVDDWTNKQEDSLQNLLLSLTLVNCIHPLVISDSPAHGHFIQNNVVTDVLVVTGNKHSDNMRYAKGRYPGKKARSMLVISCDKLGTSLLPKEKYIWDCDVETKWCSIQGLRDSLSASTLQEFHDELNRIVGD